jgi:hypothetical protein
MSGLRVNLSLPCATCAIAADDPDVCYLYARRQFHLDRVQPGKLLVASRLFARVWVNGIYLGQTYIRTHADELRWQECDLTPLLQAGENVVGILVHSWGEAAVQIDGVPPAFPVQLVCAGSVGDIDFSEPTQWRVLPAPDYRPAPRIGALMGHAEYRDLRAEPLGWNAPGFDDAQWAPPAPIPIQVDRILPSPLRPLAEEMTYPERLVLHGTLCAGQGYRVYPPAAGYHHWHIRFTVHQPVELTFFVPAPLSKEDAERLIYAPAPVDYAFRLDGRQQTLALAPVFLHLNLRGGVFLPITMKLPPGEHCVSGNYVPPDAAYLLADARALSGWLFGIRGGAVDGIDVAWSREADSARERATEVEPDEELARLMHTIVPVGRAALRESGEIALCVEDADEVVVLEFAENMTLLPSIEVADATAGSELEIIYSERFSSLPTLLIPASYADRVILRDGSQVYETAFQYKSARVLMLIIRARGGRVVLRRVGATFRRYALDRVGRLQTSDPTLNSIWRMCRHTLEIGSQDVMVDGPWREQLLYVGDNFVQNQAAYHLFGNHELLEWQHELLRQGQMPDGMIYPNQPYRATPAQYRLLDQTLLWPVLLEHHWRYTGREAFLRAQLPAMMRLLDGFQQLFGRACEGDPRLRDVAGWQWMDHPGLVGGVVRSIRHDGIPSGMNFIYALALQSAVRLCTDFDRHDEAAQYSKLVHLLMRRLHAHWDDERGLYADCWVNGCPSPEASLHVNLLAVQTGIVRDPAALLARTWNAPDVLQICGPFFRAHLFEVLHRLGRIEAILAEIRSLWGSYLAAGLTTLPEYIPFCGEWGASVGHGWGAAPAVYIIKSIVGLSPRSPGWRETLFNPRLCDVQQVAAVVPTPYGPIEAHLGQDAHGITGTMTVPEAIHVITPETAELSRVSIRAVPTTVYQYPSQRLGGVS